MKKNIKTKHKTVSKAKYNTPIKEQNEINNKTKRNYQ